MAAYRPIRVLKKKSPSIAATIRMTLSRKNFFRSHLDRISEPVKQPMVRKRK